MAKEIKFTGKYDEVKDELAKYTFAGADGGPLTLTDIKFGEKDGSPQLEFVADACSVREQFKDVEPIETMALNAVITLKNDQSISLGILSDAFGLTGDERLKDDGEDFLRLHPEHPQSLYKRMVGVPSKSLYFKARPQAAADGTVKNVFFNVSSPPLRESAGSSKLADLRKRFNIGG